MAEAANYYRWIVDSFAPALGDRIVEAGAGIGTVSDLLLKRRAPSRLILIEPATNNIPALRRRFEGDRRVEVQSGYLEDLERPNSADSVVAVNVLEHVERDAGFVAAAFDTLAPGGALLLLVPAVPQIYGSLDRAFDHYRRYTRANLSRLLLGAGFTIGTLHYLNLLGVAAWFASGRILKRTTLGRGQVRFYDRWVIPWLRRVESRWHPPIGQSLLAIARKPSGAPSRSR